MADEFGPFPVPVAELKNFRTNWVLAAALGPLGIDRFHRGRHITGALKALTLGGAGIWWAADQFSIASGRAVDAQGHPMTGTKPQRILAAALSGVLVAGACTAAAVAALPLASEAGEELSAVIAPPPPQQELLTIASFKVPAGEHTTSEFSANGEEAAFKYTLPGPGYAYLLPAGTATPPKDAEPLFSCFEACTGTVTAVVPAGKYTLLVQTPGEGKISVHQMGVRDPQ
ncbi:TM2 domain-containing protein [Arthrobacter caoxuetaonis]|uniref:TM2 domain-containing protein n=1 Tax=Arthrobacter caoxuetaonis TaxID=2886935 RepID=A0A9X1SEE9_9MICC|nr:TM2 domain-containing protein [Arthrobacter caoxuetaonis]MCC3299787.1 TM2 domain-containing protein [Arthrobacter caoxuetaonis]USQ59313.1 TM2 domain-containing protein [Arthrobacter caoxuetaonis]